MVVAKNMAKRRLTKAKECPRCRENIETINHVLFQCSFAWVVLALSLLDFLYLPFSIRIYLYKYGLMFSRNDVERGSRKVKDIFLVNMENVESSQ